MSNLDTSLQINTPLAPVKATASSVAPAKPASIMQSVAPLAQQTTQEVKPDENQKIQYRTKEQLEELLKPIAEEYGVDVKDVEHVAKHTLRHYDKRSLLEIEDKDLASRLNYVKQALARERDTRAEGEKFKGCRVGKIAKNYRKAHRMGIDIETLNKYMDKYGESSLEDYISQQYPDMEKEEAIKKFAEENFAKVYEERINNGEDPETIQEDIRKELLALAAMAGSKDESLFLMNVAKNTGNAHITEICVELEKEAETRKAQRAIAQNATSVEYLQGVPGKDYSGNSFNACAHTDSVLDNVDADVAEEIITNITKDTDNFETTNKELLEQIQIKLANNEELTEAEQEIAQIHNIRIDLNAGILYNTVSNEKYTEKQRDNLQNSTIDVLNKHDLLTDSLIKIATTSFEDNQFNKDAKISDQKNILKKFDELSNDEFSKILEKYGTTNENTNYNSISDNKREISNNSSEKEENSVGFSTTTVSNDTTRLETLKNNIIQNIDNNDNTFEIVKPQNKTKNNECDVTRNSSITDVVNRLGLSKGLEAFRESNGRVETIKAVLENLNPSNKAAVKKDVEILNSNEQSNLIKDCKTGSTVNLLMKWVKNDAIEQLRNTKLISFALTQIKDNEIAKLDEKKNQKVGV